MADTLIASTPLATLQANTAFNRPVYESHDNITRIVASRLSSRHAALFARPVPSEDGTVSWYSGHGGPSRRWIDLTPEHRSRLDPERLSLGGDLAELAADLARSGLNTRQGNLAQILRAALEVPGIEHLHVVGDQLVLANWGFRKAGHAPVDPFAAAAMPPPSAAAVEEAPADGVTPRSPLLPWLLGALLLAALLAALLWWWLGRGGTEVPAPPPEPPVEAAPAAPEKLVLPEDFGTDRTFLEGLWRSRTDLHYGNEREKHPVDLFYRFGTDGTGELLVRRHDGSYCKAPVTADVQADTLAFSPSGQLECPDGSSLNPFSIECRRLDDGAAACRGLNIRSGVPFEAEIERSSQLD